MESPSLAGACARHYTANRGMSPAESMPAVTVSRSEREALDVEVVNLRVRGDRDRQILDREPGGVEECDVVRAAAFVSPCLLSLQN